MSCGVYSVDCPARKKVLGGLERGLRPGIMAEMKNVGWTMVSSRKEFLRSPGKGKTQNSHSTMSRLTALITGFQVLAHSVIGCCAHSTPNQVESASRCCQRAAVYAPHQCAYQRSCASDSGCPALCASSSENHNSGQQPVHHCPHDACQWVVQKDIAPTADVLQMAYLSAITQAAHLDADGPVAFAESTYAPIFAPPMRLHLWVGVLLI